MNFKFLIISLFVFISCQEKHDKLGIETARKQLKEALTERAPNFNLVKKALKNEQAAIAVAEPILFKGYGKKQIESERPYEVYLINNYWVINGTLPMGWDPLTIS
ncbi:NTF2 fold immunity protein [Mucilaginibacter sp. HD30]